MVELFGQQNHRRTRLEPSRSLPMATLEQREERNDNTTTADKPRTPTNNHRAAVGVALANHRRAHQRTASNNHQSGKSATTMTTTTTMNNPYQAGKNSRSPKRVLSNSSGKAAISNMANTHMDGQPVSVFCNGKPNNSNNNNNNNNNKSSCGLGRSVWRATVLIALGFGSGYLYHNTGAAATSTNNNRPSSSSETYMPWGYSPAADQMVMKLQHDNQVQLEEIKHLKDKMNEKLQKLQEEQAKTRLMAQQRNNNPSEDTGNEPQEQRNQGKLRGGTTKETDSENDWDHDKEKLVKIWNRSGRQIQLYWIPQDKEDNAEEWVLMSDPYVEDTAAFYLHARPAHLFAVRAVSSAEEGGGSIVSDSNNSANEALQFAVIENDHQEFIVYDNWQLEVHRI